MGRLCPVGPAPRALPRSAALRRSPRPSHAGSETLARPRPPGAQCGLLLALHGKGAAVGWPWALAHPSVASVSPPPPFLRSNAPPSILRHPRRPRRCGGPVFDPRVVRAVVKAGLVVESTVRWPSEKELRVCSAGRAPGAPSGSVTPSTCGGCPLQVLAVTYMCRGTGLWAERRGRGTVQHPPQLIRSDRSVLHPAQQQITPILPSTAGEAPAYLLM